MALPADAWDGFSETGPGRDDSPLAEAGDRPVDVPVVCVLTRFGLRSARDLMPTYRDYRRIMREVARSQPAGLLRSAFLVENPTTCYSLSFWSGEDAIAHFGTDIGEHVSAARRAFGRLRFDAERGPELWSTKWRLTSVSNNLNWDDFDLRSVIMNAKAASDDA